MLSGEAGIGKSRLMRELREAIAHDRHYRLRYQCSAHHTNSALYPIIRRLERAARFTPEDGAAAKLDKLEALLKLASLDVSSTAPLFAALLSLPGEERYVTLDLTPQQRRDKSIEALIGQALALSRKRPVLFVVEDAHWIDSTTEHLVAELIARIADAAVLVVVTHRPEYTPPWAAESHVSAVTLNRLSRSALACIFTC